jgi:hypothetical protein
MKLQFKGAAIPIAALMFTAAVSGRGRGHHFHPNVAEALAVLQ